MKTQIEEIERRTPMFKSAFANVVKFYKQVLQESDRISWVSWNDVLKSSLVIGIAVLACSLIFLCADYLIHSLINYLLMIGH